MKILIINGPNINMLGIREPQIYGEQTYAELIKTINEYAEKRKIAIETFQSNHEGDIVDKIQNAYFNGTEGIIINPAAYTHTSIAIYDAIKAVKLPTIEVHISAVDNREDFRKNNFIRPACLTSIIGNGFEGYTEAIDRLAVYLQQGKNIYENSD